MFSLFFTCLHTYIYTMHACGCVVVCVCLGLKCRLFSQQKIPIAITRTLNTMHSSMVCARSSSLCLLWPPSNTIMWIRDCTSGEWTRCHMLVGRNLQLTCRYVLHVVFDPPLHAQVCSLGHNVITVLSA